MSISDSLKDRIVSLILIILCVALLNLAVDRDPGTDHSSSPFTSQMDISSQSLASWCLMSLIGLDGA